ncbi:MAG: arsenate reductase (azurin) small subunit [Candidatus Thiodiazotropha sp. (ex Lucina aurantia)]|uniref:Arsenite oxidase subunit AioB n=2 Tax=Candidatus Thiodiazotropha TaxID=1913444 RepID=A0A7Z0VQC8_9GAMM|nr:arsenate reductase (azurin) small subunit [Candidatus Thiodiazotropha endolucinida]MBT3012221.1 arsenate reductase (azurin) small subunit [Candidatus Thiodiazotropha sp. (ex Lucina pensylvanica)]MBT3016085.1 arsenate reductase (azurin) small subunit [Candidatus Thiodiazotropha taylori]MBT3038686.1 arsenate reductase (azurin) small subunit [Candidatus Thiodiazotropha sp. (ex Codakia orbicularis)]MBV2102662.1 arsenate reductase (azurin) small subunit [Candidatus Thiodiazotropha sp. (ex Lucina 
MTDLKKKDETAAEHGKCMLNRRQFLMYSGSAAAAASTISISLFPGQAQAKARVVGYPRKLVAKLSQLKDNQPLDFNYPDDGPNTSCFVVKMDGAKAGGGIGPKRDVVGFSYLCTHQGGYLTGKYHAVGEHRVLGQCPLHLSTYDLTRHGIIVSGQAYQSIPQVLLELDGDDIYAVGMMGLIFGRNDNLMEG